MKLKSFALSMACVMAVALTGCSANRDVNSTAPIQPTNSVSADSGDQASAGINGTIQNSANVNNDATQGGGAGGTNDWNNDGTPDGSIADPDRDPSGSGNVVDDIGDAAGDLARGAGNAVRDAGNAIGNAANDVGRAVR